VIQTAILVANVLCGLMLVGLVAVLRGTGSHRALANERAAATKRPDMTAR